MLTVNISLDKKQVGLLTKRLHLFQRRYIPNIIKQTGKDIEKGAKRSIRTGGRSGIHWHNLRYRSSGDGEVPRSQSGALARSIKSRFTKSKKHGINMTVGTPLPYGEFLEKGTKDRRGGRGRITPRPWLKPQLDKHVPLMAKRIEQSLRENL